MLILIYLVSVLKHTDTARPTNYNHPEPIENSQRLMLTTPTEISLVLDSPPSTTEAMTTMENSISKSDDYVGTHPLFPIQKQTTTPMVSYRTAKSNDEEETTAEIRLAPNSESAIAEIENFTPEASIPNPESTVHTSQHTIIRNQEVPSKLSPRAVIYYPEPTVVHTKAELESKIPATPIENSNTMISHQENAIHTSHQNENSSLRMANQNLSTSIPNSGNRHRHPETMISPQENGIHTSHHNENANLRVVSNQNLRPSIPNPENILRNPETMIPSETQNPIPNPDSSISNLETIILKPERIQNLNLETTTYNPQSSNLHSKAVNPNPGAIHSSINNPRASIPKPEIEVHASHHTKVSNSEASSRTVIPSPENLINAPATTTSNQENAIPNPETASGYVPTSIPKPEVVPNLNLEAAILNPENAIQNPEPTISNKRSAVPHPEATVDNLGTTIPKPEVAPNLNPQAALLNPQSAVLYKEPIILSPETKISSPETTVYNPESSIPIPETGISNPEHVISSLGAMHSGSEMILHRNLETASPNHKIVIPELEEAHNPNPEILNREIILPDSEMAPNLDLDTAISKQELIVSKPEDIHDPNLETAIPSTVPQRKLTTSLPETTIPYSETTITNLEGAIPIPETSVPNPEAASPFKRSLSIDELKMFATTTELTSTATTDTIPRVDHTEEPEVKRIEELPSDLQAPSTTNLPYDKEGTTSPGTPSPRPNADLTESDNLFMDNWSQYISQDDNDSQIHPPEEIESQLIDLAEPSESFFQNEEFIPLEAPIPENSDSQKDAQLTEETKPSKGLFKQDSFKDTMHTLETPPLLSPGGFLDLFTLDHLPSNSNIRPTWWAKPNNAPVPLPSADTNAHMKSYKRQANGILPIEQSAEMNAVPKIFNHLNQFEDLDTLLSEKLKDSVNFLERLFGNLLQ